MVTEPLEAVGAVDVSVAAERLGISVSTLEAVLERGLLKGFRDGEGRWKVLLESGGANGSVPPFAMPRDATAAHGSALARIVEESRSPIERVLAEQVEFLREQLAQRDRAIVDKDRMIADLTRARLEAPKATPSSVPPVSAINADDLRQALSDPLQKLGQQIRQRDQIWVAAIAACLFMAAVVALLAFAGNGGRFP